MSDSPGKIFLIIFIVGILIAFMWFYLFPVFGTQSLTRIIVSLTLLPFAVVSLAILPKAMRKVKRILSPPRLNHFLWFILFFTSLLILRRRDSIQLAENPVDFAALVRILMVSIVGIVVFTVGLVNQKTIMRQLVRGLPGLMFAYGLIGIISTVYSVYPALTFYKACEIIVDVSMIAFFLSCYSSQKNMKRWIDFTWFMIKLLIAFVWVGAIFSPNQAFRPISRYEVAVERSLLPFMLHGVMPIMNANSVGFLSALLCIVSFSRLLNARDKKERAMYVVFLIAGSITLFLAQSRTSMFGSMFSIVAILLLRKRFKFAIVLVLLLIIAISFTGLIPLVIHYIMRGQVEKQFFALSGRFDLWSLGWEKFKASPAFGYGFGAGARFKVLLDVRPDMAAIHGAWLEILINVGIIGTIPVALAFIAVWWNLLRINLRPPAWFDSTMRMLSTEILGVYILLCARLFTSGSFLHDRTTLLFLLVVAYVQYIRNREKTGKNLNADENSSDTQSIQIPFAQR